MDNGETLEKSGKVPVRYTCMETSRLNYAFGENSKTKVRKEKLEKRK